MIKAFEKLLENKAVKRFKDYFTKFVGSDAYMILIMAAAVINWKFRVIWVIFIVGLSMLFPIIIFGISRLKLVPVILGTMISLRLGNKSAYLVPAIIALAIVFPLLAYDLFRKKVKYDNKIFIGMIFLMITMIFSIVNAPNVIMPMLGIIMMFCYTFLFLYYYNKRGSGEDLKRDREYLCRTFNYMVIGILFEVLLYMLEIQAFSNLKQFFSSKQVILEWAMTNYIAMILLMIIPLSSYLYINNQKKIYLLLFIVLEFFLVVIMLSRGAYLAILIVSVPFIIYFTSGIKDKITFTKLSLFALFAFLIITLTVLIPSGIVKSFFTALDQRGTSLSGRQILYKVGMQVFKTYPLFGGGVYTSEYYISLVAGSVYYHNFFVQTLATIGIVGFIAFAFYIFQILRTTTKRGSYNTYVLFIIINITIHGLFDTTYYNPLVMVILSLVLPLLKPDAAEPDMKGDAYVYSSS